MNSAAEVAALCVLAVLTLASLWRELALQAVIAVMLETYAIAAVWFWLMKEPCWWLPLIVLNSRGSSRWVLRKAQHSAHYGWLVLALACLLSTLLRPQWSTPVLAALMQLAAVPWLIKRRPGREQPTHFALVNWLLVAGWVVIAKAG